MLAKNDLLPLPKRFSHLHGNMPRKRLSPEMQGVPGADAVAEGHGGMVPVFLGAENGRRPGSTQPRRGDEMNIIRDMAAIVLLWQARRIVDTEAK